MANYCPQCRLENLQLSRFCEACGTPLQGQLAPRRRPPVVRGQAVSIRERPTVPALHWQGRLAAALFLLGAAAIVTHGLARHEQSMRVHWFAAVPGMVPGDGDRGFYVHPRFHPFPGDWTHRDGTFGRGW